MRWRSTFRPLLLIAILLPGGAVVNVGVAWVLVGAPDSWTPGPGWWRRQSYRRDAGEAAPLQRMAARVHAPPHGAAPASGFVQWGRGWSVIYVEIKGDRGSVWWRGMATEGGWPMRSMRAVRHTALGSALQRETHFHSVALPRGLLPGKRGPPSTWFPLWRDRIPLEPIPVGFLVNTLPYAGVLALPLGASPIRRRAAAGLRARRGRCPKCGYDLAGLAGAAACPECGAVRGIAGSAG